MLLLGLVSWAGADVVIKISDKMLQNINQNYGQKASARVSEWRSILLLLKDKDEQLQLRRINDFFNRMHFIDDKIHWNKEDYWATPLEFLATNAGDCEDFTIAKYFSLRQLGVSTEKLRLMYVKAIRLQQAHMVLAYYPTPDSVPLVLDNINKQILPANKRKDLRPVYSFNGNGLWLAKAQGRGRKVQSGGNVKLWQDLNKRIEQGQ